MALVDEETIGEKLKDGPVIAEIIRNKGLHRYNNKDNKCRFKKM